MSAPDVWTTNAPFINEKVAADAVRELASRARSMEPVAILDLGSGQGYNALLVRNGLDAKGIAHRITCADTDDALFKLHEVPNVTFVHADLDKDFALGEFDVITATEVIEHLEDPYHFVRNCLRNLKADGVLYLSSPNVHNIYSLLKILIKGVPSMFHPHLDSDHIMPVSPFLVRLITMKMEAETGRRLRCETYYNRNVLLSPIGGGKTRPHLTLPGGNRFFGEIGIYKITRRR